MARKGGMATGVEVARISVKVSPDTKRFRGELQKELEEIERTMKGDIEVKANLDAAQASADFKRLLAQMKAQGAKGVKINTSVAESPAGGGSNSGGGRKPKTGGVDEDANFLKRAFENLKNKLLSAPSFGSGINLTGYLIILTALAAVLAPIAGVISALLLSLPGLIALIATPIAALMLGLDGLKKAAEVLKQPFQELKDVMSSAVQDQFSPVFERLKSIFPALKESLPAVTQGLSQMLDSVVRTATSEKGLESIRGTIANIGGALQGMAPGIGDFTEALMTLANSFTGGPLQGLVEWFNGAMASFNKFVTQMQASGQLEAVFQGLGIVLKIIMDTLGAIAKIGLDTLSDPEAMLAFTVALKGVAAALIGIFAASKAFLNAIGTAAIFLAELFTKIAVAATAVGTKIAMWVTEMAAKIQGGVANIVSFFSALPGQLMSILGNLGGMLLGAGVAMINGLLSGIQSGVAGVISFMSGLPGQILGALGNLGGLLLGAGKAIMDGLLSGLKSAWEGVKNFVSGIAGWIKANKGPISYDKTVLEPNGQALMQGLGKGLENGFQPVLDQAKAMAGKIADAFASGGDPTQITAGFSGKEVSNMEKTLALESKRLSVQARALDYQAKTTGNAALKARADEIRLQKDQIDLQKDMLSLTQEYSDTAGGGSKSDNPFLASIQELMKLPSGFASATAGQAMQDLNISGDGALQAVAGWGMDFAKKGVTNIFNTSNVDDTLALHNNQTNKQAQGMVGR